MALLRAHHGARRGGGRALLLGPAGLGKLRLAAALVALALGTSGCAEQMGAARVAEPGRGKARVTAITDGDTITLSGIGKTRLIGIDTPEVYGQSECYGQAASAFTKRV